MRPVATLRFFCEASCAGLQHAADARSINRERFLHEHVDPFLDGIFEVDVAKGRRRGQQDHVAFVEAINRFLEGVHPDNRRSGGTSTWCVPVASALPELLWRRWQKSPPSPKLGGPRWKRLRGRARTAAAAPDQGDFDGVILGGVTGARATRPPKWRWRLLCRWWPGIAAG